MKLWNRLLAIPDQTLKNTYKKRRIISYTPTKKTRQIATYKSQRQSGDKGFYQHLLSFEFYLL